MIHSNKMERYREQPVRTQLPIPNRTGGAKPWNCCPSPPNFKIDPSTIPLEILLDHIAPFLDRKTHNACLLLCRRAQHILKASWWRQMHPRFPPWPGKLVSRDPTCRVQCLTFSDDHSLLACGCSDGKIRSWDVRTGELPHPYDGHFPDEAVVALAYSKKSAERQLLASSSTDGTIRIWRAIASCDSGTWRNSDHGLQIEHTSSDTKRDDNSGVSSEQSLPPCCLVCILADHGYSLHFSPDDSYLVSGHLPVASEDAALHFSETIQIWDAQTGNCLRRLDGGGVPIAFLPSIPTTKPKLSSKKWTEDSKNNTNSEDRLISSCGSSKCLKLWSLKNTHGKGSDSENNETTTTSKEKDSVVDTGRCIQRWPLDRYNTVMPVSTSNTVTADVSCDNKSRTIDKDEACSILVAAINGPDSFAVWNTGRPRDSQTFGNTSPYEIRFSPDGRKVASVDDFNKVKVWRVSDGILLKTFCGNNDDVNDNSNYLDVDYGSNYDNNDVDASDSSFVEDGDGGLFPIHELVFSTNSSTVAVISRCYNEVHLFSA